ncbi:alpha-hydroxy acid oxidase [Nocardioides sp. CFH 31398]|uniref:alpha-hydroxy acid oxidase n=1 Tax=Nocardioides sp. CFH 31398 TaxID=2919579 RepID=UPI001F055423|nr:alpha-hydroxy acid oxidase [Nocardioides sp. CFH 31398]MCH1869031.1 alpha-hydroxy-acid oxidizing protein [Nocardioides sp. CFH 31398]
MDGARTGFDHDPIGGAVGEYVAQGSGSGVSVGEAGAAWRDWRILPRTFVDTTTVSLGCTLLGRDHATAFGAAPTTLQRAVHPDGELAVARACAAAGTPLVVSSNAATPFAEIGATGVDWWLQAYVPQDRPLATGLLGRAVEAGARAVVLTADTPVVSTRLLGPSGLVWDVVPPSSVRVNFDPGYDDDAPGAQKATDLGPQDVAWLGDVTGLPVVVKGVLDPDGARRCVEAGAAAVWVSTHGGRQLDRVVPTAHALPEVVAAVAGDVEVYVDGGVRDGIDLLVAWGLGARCVFLGRPVSWALRDGADGVAGWIDALSLQAVEALRLAGCTSPGDAAGLRLRPVR